MKRQKTIVSLVLLLALLIVQVMQVIAKTDAPSKVCSTFSSLYQALIQANDGDVIGIDGAIIMNTAIDVTLGYTDKHITLVRMDADAHIEVNASQKTKIQNITFDGNGIQGNQPMCIVYSKIEFDDVEFLDCQTNVDGGAVQVYVGNMTLNRCTFKGNTARNGGHIAVFNGSVLNLTECSLTEGHATEYGGAIYYESTAAQYGEAASSVIHGNSTDISGGGIYIASGCMVIDAESKLYGNTAPKGEDMTVLVTGNGSYTAPPDSLFDGENIKINGWNWMEDPDTATKYYKLDYEEIVEPTPTEPDTGETEAIEPDDSGSGDDSGNTGDSGKEDPSKPSQTDPGDSSGDQDGTDDKKDDGSGSTEQPATGSNATTTDNSSHDSTTTTTDNRQITSTTDNSDHSRTESSDNHSSTTYNYYQNQQQQTPVQQPQMRSEQAEDPIVINNYIQPSEQALTGSQEHQEGIQTESQTIIVPDPGNNIRIDAKGSDVTFEVKDGVYSISINASEPVQEADSSVNWYEVIKIVLLAILVINMLWKPRQKDLP